MEEEEFYNLYNKINDVIFKRMDIIYETRR